MVNFLDARIKRSVLRIPKVSCKNFKTDRVILIFNLYQINFVHFWWSFRLNTKFYKCIPINHKDFRLNFHIKLVAHSTRNPAAFLSWMAAQFPDLWWRVFYHIPYKLGTSVFIVYKSINMQIWRSDMTGRAPPS